MADRKVLVEHNIQRIKKSAATKQQAVATVSVAAAVAADSENVDAENSGPRSPVRSGDDRYANPTLARQLPSWPLRWVTAVLRMESSHLYCCVARVGPG